MNSDPPRVVATYRLRVLAKVARRRAQQLALEQSVEMDERSITDGRVLESIVARVLDVTDDGDGAHTARLALSAETVGDDAGQLMNMLFGNCSLQSDVELIDFDVPAELARVLAGPNHGVDGMRRIVGVPDRPLTCTALKPIGSTLAALAQLSGVFANAGVDVIKDDHGWTDQRSAPFVERVRICQRAVREASGGRACYAPSVYGHLEQMREQIKFASDQGVRMVLITPMVCGVANFVALRREFSDIAFIAHPSLGGLRIAPPALLGKLFRLFGADAVIFPNHGGRFGYSQATCRAIAGNHTQRWHGVRPTLPTPAGGMSIDRVPEIVGEYGRETMLLIGGALLIDSDQIAERSAQFVGAVAAASLVIAA